MSSSDIVNRYRSFFSRPQRIIISGASGLIGSALRDFLQFAGHEVFQLKRHESNDPYSIYWSPHKGAINVSQLERMDHVIHLSGENIAQRWTKKTKEKIISSRVASTRLLVHSIKSLRVKPKTFICASAAGYYGTNQQVPLDETALKGDGFLSDVVEKWESQALPLRDIGIRVCHARTSIVLSRKGGALAKLLPLFQIGLGGPIGRGENFMSCIALEDAVHAFYHLLADPKLEGPFNLSLPEQAPTNLEFSRALATVIKRPCIFRIPSQLIQLILGQMADETILSSINVKPEKLLQSGFTFQFPSLHQALEAAIK